MGNDRIAKRVFVEIWISAKQGEWWVFERENALGIVQGMNS